MDKPHIIEIKQIWEQTSKLDNKREIDQEMIDDILCKIFWNPMKVEEPQNSQKLFELLNSFYITLRSLHDKYQQVYQYLMLYYPEVFINGPK